MYALYALIETLYYIGRSRSSLYRDVADELCTKPVKRGPRSVGWPKSELEEIRLARMAGCSDEEIRRIVKRLHKERETNYERFILEKLKNHDQEKGSQP
jgi:prophage regulatory protein